MAKLLVVEDDKQLGRAVETFLRDAGFSVVLTGSAQEAFDALAASLFDLIISDIMMPGMDGFALAEAIRNVDPQIPIIFMTARDDLGAKRRGFRLGIDDYLVKPFELDELEMRVRALLRRAHIEMEKKLTCGNLTLDADARTATVGGEEVALTAREFNLVFKLLSTPNKTLSRAQLLDEFWGVDSNTSLRAVDVYVTNLRSKLSACDGFSIVTVRGLGYKAVPV